MEPMTPTKYLHTQLGFSLREFQELDKATKDWYREAALEEMKVLGIPAKVS